ncbi:MAG: M48 family metalloprotease [Arenimonas sp.]
MKFTRPLLCAAALALATPASAQLKPVTREEIAIGSQQYLPSQQTQGGPYLRDAALQAYVDRIGQRLAKASEFPDLPYEFTVINNGELNAWALPGGKIAVNRGLLLVMEDEAQLAAVLAHEISHVTRRHAMRMRKKSQTVGVIGALAGLAIGSKAPQYSDLAMKGAGLAVYGTQANYSRDHELQADSVGMKLMSAAGYDPMAAVEIQQIFLQQSQGRSGGGLQALFASHPPSQARVDANRKRLAQLPAGGERGKPAYAAATAKLRADKPAFDALQEAVAAYGKADFATALSRSERAIALQPKEGLAWEMKGQSQFKLGRKSDSLAAFDKAVTLSAGFFRPVLLRGLVHQDLGKLTEAENDLLASRKILPTQIAAYQLGEISRQRGRRDAAIGYYREAAQGGGEIGEAAKRRLLEL